MEVNANELEPVTGLAKISSLISPSNAILIHSTCLSSTYLLGRLVKIFCIILQGVIGNIQFNTLASIPDNRNNLRHLVRNSWDKNNQTINFVLDCALDMRSREELDLSNSFYVSIMMVKNAMSIVPKVSEVCELVLHNIASLAFISETWLHSSIAISQSLIFVATQSFVGTVCLIIMVVFVCINAEIRCKRLDDLSCCADYEVLWIQLRSKRLPRGVSSLIVAAVYHPHWSAAESEFMLEHFFQSLQLVESRFPDCALIVAGDFNRLDMKSIERHFRLKQIVKIATRQEAILDRFLTNLHRFYDTPQGFPPFGLSDHNTIIAKVRDNCCQQSRFVFKRGKRESRRAELGIYTCV